ncbi:MAG: Ig-like domain-containing protein [Akkermansiaceae bacterium]
MSTATPSASGTNALGGSITSGNNNGMTTLLTSSSVSSGYAGFSGSDNAGAAARTGVLNTAASGSAYFEVSLTPQNGATLTLSEISFGSRGTGTGPQAYTLRTSTDSYAADYVTGSLLTNSTWALKTNTGLSLAFSSAVTFRIYGHSGAGSPAVNTANWRIDDLTFKTSTSGGEDITLPTISTLSPPDEGSGVVVGSNLVVTFSENITKIPEALGVIEIRKSISPFDLVESFPIGSDTVVVSGNTMTINPTADLTYSTGYYVTIPADYVEDTAGNNFVGVPLSTTWNFTTESAPAPPPVVINKYLNGTPDMVELLVVGNGVTGTTWDLRGMIVKDFTTNMGGDGGGKYTFNNDTFWSAVPVGTLVVLSKSVVSSDTDPAGFNLSIGLDDPTYFTNDGGAFDVATTDMVMIKAAGTGVAGVTGGIHALAGGVAGSQFTSFTGAKLLSSGTTASGNGAIATNSTSSLADYNGTDATSGALTITDFGVPNNLANVTYVFALRGTVPGDGSGLAAITNATIGSFAGKNIFSSAQADNQSVKLVLNAQLPSVTLTDVEITVPIDMGAPTGVSVTGAGAGVPVSGISGQTVTISGLALTNANLVDVTISGLDTPVTTAASNGSQPFVVKTAKSGGTLTAITTQPVARVIIPIEALRDVDANGVSLDAGAIVAVEGVCTAGQFYTNNTLAVLQDGNFGITIFRATAVGNPFVRGKRFAVLGSVGQFNGVTQVTPTSFDNVVDLGSAAEPAPLVISIPDLLTTPEAYEGRLITVENIARLPGITTWGSAAVTNTPVSMQDTALTPNQITILVTNNSGAFTPPPAAANITGIFSQNDNSSPFVDTYQLLPRAQADIVPLDSGYETWIDGFFPGETDPLIIGFGADPDGDGIANGVEALIGGSPNAAGVFATTELTKTADGLTFLYPQAKIPPSGVTAGYEWSTDMANWQASGVSFGEVTVTLADVIWDDTLVAVNIYQVTAAVTAGTAPKLFVRVKAMQP